MGTESILTQGGSSSYKSLSIRGVDTHTYSWKEWTHHTSGVFISIRVHTGQYKPVMSIDHLHDLRILGFNPLLKLQLEAVIISLVRFPLILMIGITL